MAKVFNDDQNEELREALRTLKERRHYSQAALAQLLGIKQQNVGRLLKSDDEGFAYQSATRLVRLVGFRGVDQFFARRGVSLPKAS